jgi:hypothetical protein
MLYPNYYEDMHLYMVPERDFTPCHISTDESVLTVLMLAVLKKKKKIMISYHEQSAWDIEIVLMPIKNWWMENLYIKKKTPEFAICKEIDLQN